VMWVDSVESSTGSEEVFFGDDAGMVYQMCKGTSFDGDDLDWYFQLHFNHMKSPTSVKKYRGCTLELRGEGYAEFAFNYELGYGDEDLSQPTASSSEVSLKSSFFDEEYFDECYFDGQTLTPSRFDVCGNAENISLMFSGSGVVSSQISMSGATMLYTFTREKR
jgi:hypothetical protein